MGDRNLDCVCGSGIKSKKCCFLPQVKNSEYHELFYIDTGPIRNLTDAERKKFYEKICKDMNLCSLNCTTIFGVFSYLEFISARKELDSILEKALCNLPKLIEITQSFLDKEWMRLQQVILDELLERKSAILELHTRQKNLSTSTLQEVLELWEKEWGAPQLDKFVRTLAWERLTRPQLASNIGKENRAPAIEKWIDLLIKKRETLLAPGCPLLLGTLAHLKTPWDGIKPTADLCDFECADFATLGFPYRRGLQRMTLVTIGNKKEITDRMNAVYFFVKNHKITTMLGRVYLWDKAEGTHIIKWPTQESNPTLTCSPETSPT